MVRIANLIRVGRVKRYFIKMIFRVPSDVVVGGKKGFVW